MNSANTKETWNKEYMYHFQTLFVHLLWGMLQLGYQKFFIQKHISLFHKFTTIKSSEQDFTVDPMELSILNTIWEVLRPDIASNLSNSQYHPQHICVYIEQTCCISVTSHTRRSFWYICDTHKSNKSKLPTTCKHILQTSRMPS